MTWMRRTGFRWMIGILTGIGGILLCILMLTGSWHGSIADRLTFGWSAARIADDADKEGRLIVYGVIERPKVDALLAAFRRKYPAIVVDYSSLSSADLYRRVRQESDRGGPTADFAWSSAMDLQIKLVNDGYAQSYVTPQASALPRWALWKDEAWGVTAEPIVIAYNRKLVPPSDVPRTHDDFLDLLNQPGQPYRGRIATYDPIRSAVGYLYITQDEQASHDTSKLLAAMVRSNVTLHNTTESMIAGLAGGRQLFAFNLIGSYALEQQARDGSIGIIFPSDYTLVMSRIALIPRRAPHPNAARLFLDFLLSREGQAHLVGMYMTPVRSDVPTPASFSPPADQVRAIRVGPALLVSLDQLKKKQFQKYWDTIGK